MSAISSRAILKGNGRSLINAMGIFGSKLMVSGEVRCVSVKLSTSYECEWKYHKGFRTTDDDLLYLVPGAWKLAPTDYR